MKKLTLVIAACIVFNSAFSQVKTVESNNEKIGSVKCYRGTKIDLETKDTISDYAVFVFQNAKYTAITDTKIILLYYNKESLSEFSKTLELAKDEIGQKSTVEWKKEMFSVSVYDFNKSELYLYAKDGGYTRINKKQAGKLIEWINELDIMK